MEQLFTPYFCSSSGELGESKKKTWMALELRRGFPTDLGCGSWSISSRVARSQCLTLTGPTWNIGWVVKRHQKRTSSNWARSWWAFEAPGGAGCVKYEIRIERNVKEIMNNIAQIHSHIFLKNQLWNLPWIFVPLYPGKDPFSIAQRYAEHHCVKFEPTIQPKPPGSYSELVRLRTTPLEKLPWILVAFLCGVCGPGLQ